MRVYLYSNIFLRLHIYVYIIIIIHRRRRRAVMKTGFCVMTALSVGPEGNAQQEERGPREMTASFAGWTTVRGSLSDALLRVYDEGRHARLSGRRVRAGEKVLSLVYRTLVLRFRKEFHWFYSNGLNARSFRRGKIRGPRNFYAAVAFSEQSVYIIILYHARTWTARRDRCIITERTFIRFERKQNETSMWPT